MNDSTKSKVHILRHCTDDTRRSYPRTGLVPTMILVGAEPDVFVHCVNVVTNDETLGYVSRRAPWELTFLYEQSSIVHAIVEDSARISYGNSQDMRLWTVARVTRNPPLKHLVAAFATDHALKGCLDAVCGPDHSYIIERRPVGRLPFVRAVADLIDDGPPVKVEH